MPKTQRISWQSTPAGGLVGRNKDGAIYKIYKHPHAKFKAPGRQWAVELPSGKVVKVADKFAGKAVATADVPAKTEGETCSKCGEPSGGGDCYTCAQREARARKAIEHGGTGKIAGYPVHPAAAELPLMPETELSELAASIKANGQRFPVMLHEGKVIDGRNRLLACEIAGVTPRTSELGNTGLVEFIADANLRRRQLKQDQRAAIAARLVRHYKSEAAKAPKPKPNKKTAPGADSRSTPKPPTVAEVAKSHGLGKRTVERALEVEKKSPELLDKVLKGEQTLKEAERHVTRGTTGDDDKNERFTPRWLIQRLHEEYDFSVDAAAHPKSPATKIIGNGWTREDDGLEESWRGKRVWCNPPFDECEAWVEKALREVRDGGCPLALLLIPAVRCEQDWWQDNIEQNRDHVLPPTLGSWLQTRFLRGRTRFGYPGDPEGEHSGSPEFGCVLVLFASGDQPDLRALNLVEPKETPAPKVEKVATGPCSCRGFEPAISSLDPTCVCGHHVDEHEKDAGACRHGVAAAAKRKRGAKALELKPLADRDPLQCIAAGCSSLRWHESPTGLCSVHEQLDKPADVVHRTVIRAARKKKAEPAAGVAVHTITSEFTKIIGPGAEVPPPEKKPHPGPPVPPKPPPGRVVGAAELPFSARCSVAGCQSDAALGEDKCASHLVAEDDAKEAAAPKPNLHSQTGKPRRIKETT